MIRLNGLGGNDTLIGGAGDDHLTGGAGADLFVQTAAGGNDLITDLDMTLSGGRKADQLDVSDLRSLNDQPIEWRDVTVSDDGFGNAKLMFPKANLSCWKGLRQKMWTANRTWPGLASPALPRAR